MKKKINKTQHSFMKIKKVLSKLGTKGNFLNLIKNTYKTPSANVLPNGEKRCCPAKIRTELGMLSLTCPTQHHTGNSGQ